MVPYSQCIERRPSIVGTLRYAVRYIELNNITGTIIGTIVDQCVIYQEMNTGEVDELIGSLSA